MGYLNKDEATKAFEIAKENLGSGKYEEALISANEARQMNPELPDIKKLVTLLQVMSAGPGITHYGILGVEETAKENEIYSAFRKLSVDLNPDTNHFPKASEAFRRIYEAMRVLSNDRSKYDNDLAVDREAGAVVAKMVAEYEAMQGFAFDLGARARAANFGALQKDFIDDLKASGQEVAQWKEATFGKFVDVAPARRARLVVFDTSGGMFPFSELQAAFQKEKAAVEALHGGDFFIDREAHARAVPEFEAMCGKDVSVTLGCRGSFGVLDTFDGMISSSELQAAFEAYDEEPQSTTHHPSQKRFVCSSNEVAGRGTKRSNTTQATLTHPVPKKKMDGQSPLFFK